MKLISASHCFKNSNFLQLIFLISPVIHRFANKMFRKPKSRNIRQRQREVAANSDDEGKTSEVPIKEEASDVVDGNRANDDDENDVEDTPLVFSKPTKPTLLSFDQDEGEAMLFDRDKNYKFTFLQVSMLRNLRLRNHHIRSGPRS